MAENPDQMLVPMGPVVDALRELAARTVPKIVRGVVVTASPLVVQLDGEIDKDGNLKPAPASSEIGPLTVGQRVVCVEQHRRVIVIAAPEADTGWVTSGLSFTAQTDFTVDSYRLRRIGNRVTGTVGVTYSGATVTADSAGNFGDIPIARLNDTAWQEGTGRPNGTPCPMIRPGISIFWARAENSATGTGGMLRLAFGSFAGQAFDARAYLVEVDYLTD